MSSPLFFFMFVLIVITLPWLTSAIVLFSLVIMEPVPEVKNLPETENYFLHKTAPVLKSTVHEKGDARHCPRIFRANTMLEVEVVNYASF